LVGYVMPVACYCLLTLVLVMKWSVWTVVRPSLCAAYTPTPGLCRNVVCAVLYVIAMLCALCSLFLCRPLPCCAVLCRAVLQGSVSAVWVSVCPGA